MPSLAHQQEIITAGINAPSADNSQPMLYAWQENQLQLWIDTTRAGKASDNRWVLADIALGAVIENCIIAANALGYQHTCHYFPDDKDDSHVANISFETSEKAPNGDLAQFINKRCTDRRLPFKGKIAAEELDQLAQCVEHSSCKLTYDLVSFGNSPPALPVITKAESIRFKSKILHQELFSTVKFDNTHADEGMPVEVLAIEKPALPMFKLLSSWKWMNRLNKIGAHKMLGMRSVYLPIITSPALCLLSIKDNDRVSIIEGGRSFQHLWLKATELGMSLQPYAAPGIFSLGFVACEPKYKSEMAEIGQMMQALKHPDSGFGLMYFRLGRNGSVKHRTKRRQLSTFLKYPTQKYIG
ncbi:hypothetical protein [Thalassotalea fusca]